MSTKAIRTLVDLVKYAANKGDHNEMWNAARDAEKELEAIERAAVGIVRWNNEGQPRLHADAARGWSVLESIAREAK